MSGSEEIYDASGVVDRVSTAEEAAALSAARTKLAEVTGSRPAAPPAGSGASRVNKAAPAAPVQMSPTEARLAELNAPGSPIWDEKHQKHAESVAELRRLVVEADTPEERAAFEEAPIEEQRAFYGLDAPVMPPVLAGRYDAWAESEFVSWSRREGLDKAVVRDVRDWAIREAVNRVGGAFDDATLAEFADRFKGRLSPDQITLLQRFYKEEVATR